MPNDDAGSLSRPAAAETTRSPVQGRACRLVDEGRNPQGSGFAGPPAGHGSRPPVDSGKMRERRIPLPDRRGGRDDQVAQVAAQLYLIRCGESDEVVTMLRRHDGLANATV